MVQKWMEMVEIEKSTITVSAAYTPLRGFLVSDSFLNKCHPPQREQFSTYSAVIYCYYTEPLLICFSVVK